jgi:hypothetical protein
MLIFQRYSYHNGSTTKGNVHEWGISFKITWYILVILCVGMTNEAINFTKLE